MRFPSRLRLPACALMGVAALWLGFAACNISIDSDVDDTNGDGTSGGGGGPFKSKTISRGRQASMG